MIDISAARRDRNNKIINGIMSGHSPVLLLCPSEPSYLDFLPDLINNYRTVYVYNAAWDTQIDFLLFFAKAVFTPEEFDVAEAYVNCRQDDYENILLKKILSKISLVHNDCLFFLSGLESLKRSFDLSVFERMAFACPDNLKLVFCSTIIPHMTFRVDDRIFPRIIVCDRPGEELPFSESLFSDGTLDVSQKEILQELSVCPYIDKDFAEELYPGSAAFLTALSRNFRPVLLMVGNYCRFHPAVGPALEKALGKKPSRTLRELNERYIRFCFEHGRYKTALEKAVAYREPEWVEKSVAVLYDRCQEDYVYRFFKNNVFTLPDSPLCLTFKKSFLGDLGGARECSKKIETESVRKKLFYMLSFGTDGRKEAFAQFCNEIVKTPNVFFTHIRLIATLSYSEKKVLGALPGVLKMAERRYEEGTKDIVFLHYASKIYSAIGNYADAKKFLLRIKEVCDYYNYSYVQSWSFFFNMPIGTVAAYAKETDNTLLECCSYLYDGNKTQALSCLKRHENKDKFNPEGMLGLALQSLFYAEAGNPDFGRTLALLYAVACEREDRDESSLFYTSLAYCEWMLRNNARALTYLQKAQKTSVDAFFSFLAKALEINCNLESASISVNEKRLEKLLLTAQEKGYDNAIMVLRSVFTPLLTYAEKNGLCAGYIATLRPQLARKKETMTGKRNIQVKFFGGSAVYMDKREIFWKTKKCKELFLLYSLYPDGIERNKIISEIWSDYVYASAINNLKTTNNLIRKTLKEYGIPFDFVYANGKYKLMTEYSESDVDVYRGLQKEYNEATDLRKRAILAGRMLSLTDEGFAPDCELPCFRQENQRIKEEQSLLLTGLIKEMIRLGDYLSAKRFLLRLEKIGLFDCDKLRAEIDRLV